MNKTTYFLSLIFVSTSNNINKNILTVYSRLFKDHSLFVFFFKPLTSLFLGGSLVLVNIFHKGIFKSPWTFLEINATTFKTDFIVCLRNPFKARKLHPERWVTAGRTETRSLCFHFSVSVQLLSNQRTNGNDCCEDLQEQTLRNIQDPDPRSAIPQLNTRADNNSETIEH